MKTEETPTAAAPAASGTPAGAEAPATAPSPSETPSRPARRLRTRGVPAGPALLAAANTTAIGAAGAASVAGPAGAAAVVGGAAMLAASSAMRQRKSVRNRSALQAAKARAARTGSAVGPAHRGGGSGSGRSAGSAGASGSRSAGRSGLTGSKSTAGPKSGSPRSGSVNPAGSRSAGSGSPRSGSVKPGSGSAGAGPRSTTTGPRSGSTAGGPRSSVGSPRSGSVKPGSKVGPQKSGSKVGPQKSGSPGSGSSGHRSSGGTGGSRLAGKGSGLLGRTGTAGGSGRSTAAPKLGRMKPTAAPKLGRLKSVLGRKFPAGPGRTSAGKTSGPRSAGAASGSGRTPKRAGLGRRGLAAAAGGSAPATRVRKILGPSRSARTNQPRGGLVRRSDGSRRQPVQATKNGARTVAHAGRSAVAAGRATRDNAVKAYNSRPMRHARRVAVRTWGAAWPATCAATRGILRAVRGGRWQQIRDAMATSWRKGRARWAKDSKWAKADQAEKEAAAPGVPGDKVHLPDHVVEAPTATAPVATTGGEISMASARFNEAAAEMLGAATVYNPEGMMQVGNDFAKFADSFQNIANAMRTMTQRANDEYPLNPAIIDTMRVIYGKLQEAATQAQDLGPAFRNLHAVDIKRIEAPRRGEQRWDLSANRDHVGGGVASSAGAPPRPAHAPSAGTAKE